MLKYNVSLRIELRTYAIDVILIFDIIHFTGNTITIRYYVTQRCLQVHISQQQSSMPSPLPLNKGNEFIFEFLLNMFGIFSDYSRLHPVSSAFVSYLKEN